MKRDLAWLLQRFESGDGGEKFHAVVGCFCESAAQFATVNPVCENRGPAAGTGIPAAGAVRVNDDLFHRLRPFFGMTRQGMHPSGEIRPGVTPACSSSSRQPAEPVSGAREGNVLSAEITYSDGSVETISTDLKQMR